MFKLDEKGWGYGFLIFFAALFILILVGASITIKSLAKKNGQEKSSTDQNKNYSKIYTLLEDKLRNSGEYYVLDNEAYFDNKNESTRISVVFLKKYGYIDDILDPVDNSSWYGFVIITNDKKVSSYINCSNYKTKDYDSWS